jgi:hypothetical protein
MEFPKRVYAVMRPDGCVAVTEMAEFGPLGVELEDGEEIAVFVLDAIGKIRLGPAVTFPGVDAQSKPKATRRGRPNGAKNKTKVETAPALPTLPLIDDPPATEAA